MSPLPRLLALAAGSLDFVTGLGLVFLPAQILPLMQVTTPTGDGLIFLRFVGAFVAAVGFTYLLPLLRGDRTQLRFVFAFTIPFRIAAGAYCVGALSFDWLPLAWAIVPAADFALVFIQLWLLRQPFWSDESRRA